MTTEEKATSCYLGAYNCGQAVLATLCEKYGLSEETALKLGCGLGAGFRSGELCGAAAGAVLLIGLKHGPDKSDGYPVTEAFLKQFRERCGALRCRDILVNHDKDAGMKDENAKIANKKRNCLKVVLSALQILEEMEI